MYYMNKDNNITLNEIMNSAAKTYGNQIVYMAPQGDTDSITFSQLDSYAKSIATGLNKAFNNEINPQPVCVLTDRHVLTPACFLGISYSGCFYAPMESDLPEARLIQMLEVSKPNYLITDNKNYEKAVSICNAYAKDTLSCEPEVLLLEALIKTQIDEDVLMKCKAAITPDSPLYIIFTSGSTGAPKAVLTSHRALLCYLNALNDVIHLDSSDIMGNQSPLDYIAAIRDMYLPLLTGAKTLIIPRNITAMPNELFSMLNEYNVTTLCWSVSGMDVLTKLGAFESDQIVMPEHLKTIVFSGSVMPGKTLRKWQEAFPETRFINQYGPTETTASCTYYEVKEKVTDETVIPIGKPYNNYEVFLVNPDSREETPFGEIGEIVVSGPALAIEYYNNPLQTEEVFIPNPIWDKMNNKDGYNRAYLTGDLGRFNDDNILEFLGRKDRQIKHLGHRIELLEIDETAQKIDGVTEAISMYDEKNSLLYLFYTGSATTKDIAITFRSEKPAYMVPRKIINLTELPSLPNGKIDMGALKKMML